MNWYMQGVDEDVILEAINEYGGNKQSID